MSTYLQRKSNIYKYGNVRINKCTFKNVFTIYLNVYMRLFVYLQCDCQIKYE